MRVFLLLAALVFSPQQQCTYSDQCHSGECQVWEHGRWVCERAQYTVAVWDRTCLDKVTLKEESSMEAPVGDDGRPEMSKLKLLNVLVTTAKGCQFRYEVRHK